MLSGRALHRFTCGCQTITLVLLCLYLLMVALTWKIYILAPLSTIIYSKLALRLSLSQSRPVNYEQQRAWVKLENTDEFISQVLATVVITEVNLQRIGDQQTSKFDQEIQKDKEKIDAALGVAGVAASLEEKLKVQADEIYKTEGFNRLLSDYIPYNRSVADLREKTCANETYDEALPATSVVIIFTDEAFSTLIRTVTSVMNRTPAHLLSDIILIDDCSTREHLKGKLERYLATHFPIHKIRLARLSKRVGLIKARMLGGHLATGDVITFIDSHCEVLEHWIEPLLQRIKEDRTVIPCPQMDFIDPDTMKIHSQLYYPAFTWSGIFWWSGIPQEELDRRPAVHSPIRTPVMVGGLFAVDRQYFWEIGSFDPGMEIWGGENLEIGFRVWQCGGSIEKVLCSHVAHLPKKFTPYKGKMDNWGINTARAARVWMDEYQDVFFSFWPTLQNETIDVMGRQAFRQRKQCKSFQWYMDNVYPSKFQMQFDSKFYGQVRNEKTGYCLDADADVRLGVQYVLPIRPCLDSSIPVQQIFYLSNDGKLRREFECAIYQNDRIEMIPCDWGESNSSTWEYKHKNHQLLQKPSGFCATVQPAKNGTLVLGLKKCNLESPAQRWVVPRIPSNLKH